MLEVLDKLNEITHPGVARKQRSITRLFPEFPARVKSIGTMGGIRLLDMQPNYWHFSLHSGTKDNLWYDGYINFKDLVPFLDKHVGDKRLWTKSKEHVDLKKLAKKVMFYCNIQLKCTCPAFLYWGPAYILSLSKYDGMFGDRENRPPRIRNPKKYGAVCKHTQAMLNAYPFYMTTLAGFLRDTHVDQIRRLEDKAKEQSSFFKGIGKTLGGLFKAKQEKDALEPDEDTSEVDYDSKEKQPRDVRGRWSAKVKRAEEEEQKESITIEDVDKPILREDFEDTFKPISREEFKDRNPKPKAKKGDKVDWGKSFANLEPKILLMNPIWSDSKGRWYAQVEMHGQQSWAWFDSDINGWFRSDAYSKEIREDLGDRLGRCYELSGRYVLDNHDAILVHGSVNGIRMTGKDRDNPHAWVEEGDEVFDPVMDQRIPKEAYYGMMQAKVVKKYEWDEMAKTMLKAAHWGPWHQETNEAFEDIFKPASDKELEKRIPKDAVILITDLWWDKPSNDLVTSPRSPKDELYLKKDTIMIPEDDDPKHPYLKGVYHGGGKAITLEPEWHKPYKKKTNESFEDLFQPTPKKEIAKRKKIDRDRRDPKGSRKKFAEKLVQFVGDEYGDKWFGAGPLSKKLNISYKIDDPFVRDLFVLYRNFRGGDVSWPPWQWADRMLRNLKMVHKMGYLEMTEQGRYWLFRVPKEKVE